MERMKIARMFNPLHVKGEPVTPAMLDKLSKFRIHSHPLIRNKLREMSSEMQLYNSLAEAIPAKAERLDNKDQDTFCLTNWWSSNSDKLPAFSFVLRAVLANSPNSIPPERLFSILGNTFDPDQHRSYADYMELACMLQFNERCED